MNPFRIISTVIVFSIIYIFSTLDTSAKTITQTNKQGIDLEHLFEAVGNKVDDYLGRSVSGVGDQNGDGYDDIIAVGSNRALLFYGGNPMDTIPDMIFGPQKGDTNFGWRIAYVGDVNGDGGKDFLLKSGDSIYSKVYLFYGGEVLDTIADVTFAKKNESYFGSEYAGVGDVNGDSFNDILISAYYPEYPGSGRAFLYYGGVEVDTIPDLEIKFSNQYVGIGSPDKNWGDLNGDGYDDILVFGTRKINDIFYKYAHIHLGGIEIDTIPDIVFDELSGDIYRPYQIIGDVNGDGFYDFYGINRNDTTGIIFYGSPEIDKEPDIVIDGLTELTASLGKAIPAGDVNKDGYDDIIIGDPYGWGGLGEVLVFLGGINMDKEYDIGFTGFGYYPKVGTDVGWCGDVNGDGVDDILFSINSENWNNLTRRGLVEIFSGDSTLKSNNAPIITDYYPEEDTITMGLNDTTLFWISAHDPYDGDYINYRWYVNNRYWWYKDTLIFTPDSVNLYWDQICIGYNEIKVEIDDGYLGTTLEHIWIVAIDTNIVGISGEDISTQPNEFMLYQNYPNPFNASTSIEFMLPYGRYAALKIYNILGKEVVTLLDKEVREGSHRAVWNGKDKKGKEVSSGIYFYVLRAGNDIKVMKMVLIR
jgi:hypothetical protein